MPKLVNILLTSLALSGIIFIGLPHFSAHFAGYFIFLTLCATPFVVLLFLVEIALLLWTKSRWRWFMAVIIIGCLGVLQNHWIRPHSTQPAAHSLRVLSWNVTNFHIHKDTLKKAATFIRTLQPDIICLQERPHENLIAWETIQAAFPEYPYTLRNEEREDEVLNLAILSKYPLSESEETYYTDTYNKSMAANISAPSRKFRLHNAHLQTTQHVFTRFIENAQRRNAQADQLKTEIQASGIPTIVCGDFNDTPCSYTYRQLSFGMQDAFLKASEQWTGSFQPMGRWLRIDYLLCSPDWQVQAYQLIENPWSDHKMQLATLNY